MHYDIALWFLILSLFVPRLTLFIGWVTGTLPYNTVPFLADFVMAIFLPRVLICIYIAGVMGFCLWFWIHLAVAIVVCLAYVIKESFR